MKKLSGVAIWLIIFLMIGGTAIFSEYLSEHTYYYSMLASGVNWGLLIWAIVAAVIPLGYKHIAKTVTTRGLVYSSLIGVIVFAYAFIALRDQFIGAAYLALPINILLMIGGSSLMLGGMWSAGSMLYRRIYRQEANTLDRSVTALILGFVAALIVSWVLVMTTLLFQIVAVVCVLACGYLIRKESNFWRTLGNNISDFANKHLGFTTWTKGLTTVLLVVTLMYLLYGIMLAYIPYPTAWDANHAYMYIPKVWAEHHGYLWNSISAQFSPSPWLTYIAVRFQFGYALQSIGLWITPDTWAVMMNYLVVVPVMIFTWGLVRRVISYLNLRDTSPAYQTAWVILLSWMTCGMGAFLVFVDNKSDFGILAITLCTLILVFDWLPKQDKKELHNHEHDTYNPKLTTVLSGVIAGVAILSKPTSLFDFASVVILFAGIVAGAWAMVGTGLLIMGAMAVMKITTVPLYLSSNAGLICAVLGLILLTIGILTSGKNKLKLRSSLLRWVVVIAALLVVIKTPLMIWKQHSTGVSIGGAKGYIQGVLMGYNEHEPRAKSNGGQHILLAQSTSSEPATSCSLQSQGLTAETLYDDTQKATTEGAGEDLGRYIGYGSKTWQAPRWSILIPNDTCITIDADARVLCMARDNIAQGKLNELESKLQGDSLDIFEKALQQKEQGVSASYIQQDIARQLTLYRQDKALLDSDNTVSIPYRWIVPLNMTYNWSLQNLSSYYTDIGVVRLVLLVILLTSTIWLLVYDRKYLLIPLTAVIGWAIWWISGSAILWYGIGLIVWTMLSMVIVIDRWTHEDTLSLRARSLVSWVIGICSVIVILQLLLNFIRIGSQGGGGIFVQYKTSNGLVQNITEDLRIEPKIKYGLSGKDIFDLQFPHYNKTITAIDKNKGSKESVLIAGTYMPYFLFNQYNIIGDGFLSSMWEWFSDQDVCNSYLRLKDKDLTYLVIDPNIATVVMGEGNTTLRDRMFAKIDPVTGKIVQHGAISMLANLVSSGHIELFSTNNIGAKYAFTLSDSEIMSAFGVTKEDIALTRLKVATARFWGSEGETLLGKVLQILTQRMTGAYGIEDIADMMGKDVDVGTLTAIAQQASNPNIVSEIKELSQDERYVLVNYLSMINTAASQPQQYQQQLVGLLQQSIGGGSQLIVFKVK